MATGLGEDVEYLIEKFQQFESNGSPFDLAWIEDKTLPKNWYAGSKFMTANLFLGSYNHLRLDELILFMQNAIVWDSPESVQLIVKEHAEYKFRIIDVFQDD